MLLAKGTDRAFKRFVLTLTKMMTMLDASTCSASVGRGGKHLQARYGPPYLKKPEAEAFGFFLFGVGREGGV